MATKLVKPVKREMLAKSTVGKYSNRPILVEIDGGDLIRFRIKGTRQEYETSLHYVYRLAQIVTYESIYAAKMKKYELEKKAGMRVRKPKKAIIPLDKATMRDFNVALK